ncbi:MAG TPA: type II toxin-antitoxin system VapC family toxin [Aestuariivirgaceae bacterium]|nr:type II toxin-antitoxin system VapC family toxin [Aestuariivirgaceae bacterium]
MKDIVIDANVAAALLLDLAYSTTARQAVSGAERIVAPDLVVHEFTNALWKLVTSGKMTESFAHQALSGLDTLVSDLVAGQTIAHEAFRIATELRHPAYDCFYLALALGRNAPLLTADRRFAARVANTEFADRLQLITA